MFLFSSVPDPWHFGTNPDADPYGYRYQNLQWLLGCKKINFFYFILSMKFKNFKILKIRLMIKIKFLARKFLYYFSMLNSFIGKGRDSHPDPYLWLTDPGGPKTSGSGTLQFSPYRYRFLLFILLFRVRWLFVNKYYYSVLRIFATKRRIFYVIVTLFYVVVIIIHLFVYSITICFLEAP